MRIVYWIPRLFFASDKTLFQSSKKSSSRCCHPTSSFFVVADVAVVNDNGGRSRRRWPSITAVAAVAVAVAVAAVALAAAVVVYDQGGHHRDGGDGVCKTRNAIFLKKTFTNCKKIKIMLPSSPPYPAAVCPDFFHQNARDIAQNARK